MSPTGAAQSTTDLPALPLPTGAIGLDQRLDRMETGFHTRMDKMESKLDEVLGAKPETIASRLTKVEGKVSTNSKLIWTSIGGVITLATGAAVAVLTFLLERGS